MAFGTSNTEELSKMGIDAHKFIEGVVTQLEKGPKVLGGISNAVENMGDRMKEVIRPLGDGLATAFMALQPTIERVMSFAQERFTRLGEIIAALANSGVLEDFANRMMNVFDSLFGGDFTQGAIAGISNILSVILNIPAAFEMAKQYAVDMFEALKSNASNVAAFTANLFTSIAQNIIAAFDIAKNAITNTFIWIENKFRLVLAGIAEGIKWISLSPLVMPLPGHREFIGNLDKFIQTNSEPKPYSVLRKGQGVFEELPTIKDMMSKMTPLPGVPDLMGKMLADSGRYAAMINGSMQGLPGLPNNLNYGGFRDLGRDKESGVEATLERIERNTKSAADSLSLRRQALGGGELAALGVTPAELRGGAGRGNGGASTRGNIGKDSSMTGIARSLEYYTKRKVYETVNRAGGGGFRPRTG